jgi:hypothetical protein
MQESVLDDENGKIAALSLSAWGNIAQIVFAITGFLALIGAGYQIHLTRAIARRARAYTYVDRFGRAAMLHRARKWVDYWGQHSYAEFKELPSAESSQWMALTNLLEEVGALYDRKLVDRNVIAETVGLHAEWLWEKCMPYVVGARQSDNNPWLFDYWEHMQRNTVTRRAIAKRRLTRRRMLRKLFRGN